MKKNLPCLLGALILSGCASELPLNPEVDISDIQPFTEFSVNNSVSVKNGQPDDTKVVLVPTATKFTGSKRELTSVVVEVAQLELSKRGAIITEQAEKGFEIMVDKFSCYNVGISITCETILSVETLHGYKATYTAFGSSVRNLYHATNYSLANSASVVFQDPSVIEYLTGE